MQLDWNAKFSRLKDEINLNVTYGLIRKQEIDTIFRKIKMGGEQKCGQDEGRGKRS